jgi:protein SMG9
MAKLLLRPTQTAPVAPGSSAAAPGKSPASRSFSRSLLTEGLLEPSLDEAGQLLSDASDFTVIGVLGPQGAGKSTLMSLLAGARWAGSSVAGSSSRSSAPSSSSPELVDPPFAQQSMDAVLQALHGTGGVNLHVSSERLLLLDTQPLLSPSLLLELQRREPSLPPDVQSHENLQELQSLRIATLLLSVCHLCVWLDEEEFNPHNLRCLRAAQMLRHRLPDVSVLAHASSSLLSSLTAAAVNSPISEEDPLQVVQYAPQLAFVFNRMAPSAFDASRRATLRAALTKLFATRVHEASAAMAPAGADLDVGTLTEDARKRGGALPIFVLPEAESAVAAGALLCASHQGYRVEAERARDELLSLRRHPFAKSLTEREWLRGVGRMWELIKRSSLMADYNRALQKLHLYT